jgi:ABC-type uncharacterized transport system permease subunit
MPSPGLLASLTLIFYFLASLSAFPALFRRDRRGTLLTPAIAAIGMVTHLSEMMLIGVREGRCPVLNRYEAMSLLALLIVFVYLLAYARTRLGVLSVILPPLGLVVLTTSNILEFVLPPQSILLGKEGQHSLTVFHVTLAMVGLSALFLTFALSLIYLLQDRMLKNKQHASWLRVLPPLDRCDTMIYRSIVCGFPLLTLAIVTGSLLNASVTGHFWSWRADEAFSVIAWGIFGVIIWARLAKGWRGRKSAYLTIVGFAAGVLTMSGMFL